MKERLIEQRRRTDPLEAVRRLLQGETNQEDVRTIRDSILYDEKLRERDPRLNVISRDYLRTRICKRIKGLAPYRREDDFLGIFLVDFDKFKPFNDAYGKVVGDVALATVAYSISDALQFSETGRFGGEEFVVISNDPLLASNEHFSRSGERLVQAVERTSVVVPDNLLIDANNGIEYRPGLDHRKVTASVGGILCSNHCLEDLALKFHNNPEPMHDELIRRADIALKAAKENGRNRFVAYSENLDKVRLA